MAIRISFDGTWGNTIPLINSISDWLLGYQLYIWGGEYRPTKSYSWDIGNWGTCSKTCGTGTQTRTITCKDETDITFTDPYCIKYMGLKAATDQNCNTQACAETRCDGSNYYYYQYNNEASGGDGHSECWHYSVFREIKWNGSRVWSETRSSCDGALPASNETVTVTVSGYKYTSSTSTCSSGRRYVTRTPV